MIGCVYIAHVLYRIAFGIPIDASMGSCHALYMTESLLYRVYGYFTLSFFYRANLCVLLAETHV